MAGLDGQRVIRKKLAAGRAEAAEGGPGADRGWRRALARAARDKLKLPLEVPSLALDRRSLAELLEMPPDRALIAVLEGPGEGLGVIVISAPVLAGMIEAQMMGRVSRNATAARKPTRTDAAMVAGVIDAALAGLEVALAEEADLVWAGGFRYASFLDDPRPLGLLLEDVPYRVLKAEVVLDMGAKSGEVILALPAEGKGHRPAGKTAHPSVEDPGPAFTTALAERVSGTYCTLEAVLTRISLSLAAIMRLEVGDVLPLPHAGLDRISLEGIDGRRVGEGTLGQNRGLRAIRLAPAARSANSVAAGSVMAAPVQTDPMLSLLPTGSD